MIEFSSIIFEVEEGSTAEEWKMIHAAFERLAEVFAEYRNREYRDRFDKANQLLNKDSE